MKVEQLIEKLEIIAPPAYALSWDNVGLLIGDRHGEVHKIYIALDADSKAIETAVRNRCDLMITHHPLLFSAVKRIDADDFIGGRLIKLIANHMNYYAMHTNFDVAVMADLAAERLGIHVEQPLETTGQKENGTAAGIGTIGYMDHDMTLRELSLCVKEKFQLPDVRFYGDPNQNLHTIAMCPGSGKGMDDEAVSAGADVLITGDIGHHDGLDSVEKGLCIIDAGHHGLEHIYVDYLYKQLLAYFPADALIKDLNDSPFQIV